MNLQPWDSHFWLSVKLWAKGKGSMHEPEPAGVTLKVRFLSLSPTLRRWTGSDPLLR
jgi:hypothetical protein